MTQELYIPKGAKDMTTYPKSPKRVGIQGAPGGGKTWAALTAPNPVYCDLDNKLNGWREAHPGAPLIAVPFWDTEFIVKVMKCNNGPQGRENNPKWQPNVRDAFVFWVTEEAPKLKPEQTLIVDSWSSLQTFFDLQTDLPHEQEYSAKTGKIDTYAFWRRKLKFSKEVVSALKVLPCNVIVICHETPERDDDGRIVGIKPLQQGSYADEIAGQFTDWYRHRVLTIEQAAKIGIKQTEPIGYYWQTCKDNYFSMACKSVPGLADYIKADWSSLNVA